MLCPECKGKCCRDSDYGYRVEHMGAECYEHICEACHDGSVPQPDPRDVLIRKLREAIAALPRELEHASVCPTWRGGKCICGVWAYDEARATARRLVGLEDKP